MSGTDGEFGDSAAVKTGALVARLNNLGEIFRVQGEILATGRAAVPALATFLSGPPSVLPQPRVAAAECLGVLGGEEALVALCVAVARDHSKIPDPVVALAEESVRNGAARQLARFHDPRVLPVLLDALSRHHLIGAGEALAALGETAAIPHLIACLEDDGKRNAARESLRQFGSRATPALAAALVTPHRVYAMETPGSVLRRTEAADLLGELRAHGALPQLRTAAADAAGPVSVAAAIALARIAPAEADPGPLLFGLANGDVVTQAECEATLRQLGARVSDALRRAAITGRAASSSSDGHLLSPRDRCRTIALLSAIDPAAFSDAVPALLSDADAIVRYQVVRQIAASEDPDRAVHLTRVRNDPDPSVRAAARSALKRIGDKRPWLNRNVVGMGFTSLLSDAGHEMATAVLPAFLATIGVSAAVLGAIEGVADAVASFAKLGSGWWSDRLGHRKPITVGGYALTGLAKGLFAFAAGWPLVLTGRVIGWFGRGVRGALRDAMLAESVAPADAGKAFGFHRAGDTLGAIIGPLLGIAALGLLHDRFADPSAPFRVVFLLTLVPGLGSALAFALMVREHRRPPNHGLSFWGGIRGLPRSYRRFLAGVFIFGLADFAPTLLILRATDLLSAQHGIAHAAQLAALLYALRNVFYAAASFPIGSLADRVGRRGLLAGGYALAAVTFAGFMYASTDLGYLALLFAAAGVFIAIEDALEAAVAAELLPAETRGLGYGVLGSVNGVGDLLSSSIVGLLWTHVSVTAGLLYAVVLGLLGAIVLLRVR